MIIKKISIPIVLSIIIIACSTNNTDESIEISKEDFPPIEQLEFEEVVIPPVLLDVSNLCIVDSFLVIAQKRKDTIFYIFNLPDCRLLKSFGRVGKGPNEFGLHFTNSTLNPVFDQTPHFGTGNRMNNIQYYDIYKILNNSIEPDTIVKLPPEFNGFQTIIYIKDSVIIGAPYRGAMHLFKYKVSERSYIKYKEFAIDYPNLDDETRRTIFMSYMSLRPDNKFFVIAYGSCGQIDIYNLASDNIIKISYSDFPSLYENINIDKDVEDFRFNKNQKIFCWEIVATNNHIYAKVLNTTYTNLVDGMSFSRDFIPEIHVFDWEGNLVRIIKPDKYYYKFYVAPNDEYLYAIDSNIEDIIYRIKL
ncbi:MAG: BF3164 family lipoprotein [Bacteroidales bacterium]